LFVKDNYLLVIGVEIDKTYVYFAGTIPSVPSIYLYDTWVKIYDISNKQNPIFFKNYKIQG
jgi:hypothetical protein